MTITVVVDRQALVAMGQPTGPIGRHWVRLLADLDRRAKHKLSNDVVHVDTGNLRSSQQMPFVTMRGDRIIGVAQNVAKYAHYVHEGTAAHEIRPRTARAVTPGGGNAKGGILTGWTFGGRRVFTPIVHHPGTHARPWLRQAAEETMRTLGGA